MALFSPSTHPYYGGLRVATADDLFSGITSRTLDTADIRPLLGFRLYLYVIAKSTNAAVTANQPEWTKIVSEEFSSLGYVSIFLGETTPTSPAVTFQWSGTAGGSTVRGYINNPWLGSTTGQLVSVSSSAISSLQDDPSASISVDAGDAVQTICVTAFSGSATPPAGLHSGGSVAFTGSSMKIADAYGIFDASDTVGGAWATSSADSYAIILKGRTNLVVPPLKGDESVGSAFAWVRGATLWTNGGGIIGNDIFPLLDDPITPAEASGDNAFGMAAGANTTQGCSLTFPDSPGDLESVSRLSMRFSTALIGTTANDSLGLICRVMSGVTVLAAGNSSGDYQGLHFFTGSAGTWSAVNGTLPGGSLAFVANTGTAPGYNKTITFAYINTTATKAQWDAAQIQFQFGHETNMGNDSTSIVLVDLELLASYVAASGSQNFSDTVDTTIAATTEAVNEAQVAETLDTTVIATTEVIDTRVLAPETLDTTITATTEVVDVTTVPESLDTTVTTTTDLIENVTWVDTLDTTGSFTTDAIETSDRLETIATDGAVTTEVIDTFQGGSQTYDETGRDTTVDVTTEVVDVAARIETLDTTVTTTTDLIENVAWVSTLDTTVTTTTDLLDPATRLEILDSGSTVTTEVIDSPATAELVDTTGNCSTEVVDSFQPVESVDTTISASIELVDWPIGFPGSPNPVTDLAGTPGNGQVTLTWTEPVGVQS